MFMDNGEIQLAEFKKLLDEFKKKCPPKPVYEPTYLEICEYPWGRREEICSRLFAFFFDTRKPHGFGTLFFDTLLKVYQEKYSAEIENFDKKNILYTRSVCVETEKYTEKGNRVDLLLTTDCLKVCIENKIDAPPDNDFDDYYHYVKKESEPLKLHAICILLALCEKAEYKDVNPNFKTIYYREFLEELKQNLGDYLTQCNSKYLSVLTDFILFLDRKGGFMSDFSEDERKFFANNDSVLQKILERRNAFLDEKRKKDASIIKNIQIKLNKEWKGAERWWIYIDTDLGCRFEDGNPDYEIGIESGFNIQDNFEIHITIWNPQRNHHKKLDNYKNEVISVFESEIIDRDDSEKWQNRVVCQKFSDENEIVKKLLEVYNKLENIVDKVKNPK